MMQLIEDLGHQPVLTEETLKALARLLKKPAQIIIADMSMPSLDPAEFCRRLRQSDTGEDCYALFLASPDQEHRALEVIDAGADDVLIKPVNGTLRGSPHDCRPHAGAARNPSRTAR